MNDKSRMSKSRIFQVMFLSLCITLTVPLLILIFTYYSMKSTLEKEIKSYNQYLLNECMQSAEDVFDATDHLLNDLAFSQNTKEFLRPDTYAGSQDLIKVKQAHQTISEYQEMLAFTGILDVSIYSGSSQTIVSQIAPYSPVAYYDEIVSFPQSDLKYSDLFQSNMPDNLILPEREASVYNRAYKVIFMFKPVLVGYRSNPQDCVAAMINTEKFAEKLRHMNLGEEGFACIADNDGLILLQVHGSEISSADHVSDLNFSEKSFLRLSTVSSTGDRQYLAYIPKAVIFSQVDYLRVWIIWLCALEALLGIVSAWLLSWKNTKPILDIFELLGKNTQSGKTVRDFNFLKGSISDLVNNNQMLRGALDNQIPIVRSDFIRRILSGSVSADALVSMSQYLSCDLSGSLYSVLLVKNTGYGDTLDHLSLQELENASVLVQQTFAQSEGFRAYSTQKNEQVTSILLIFDEAFAEQSRKALENAVDKVDALLGDQYHLPLSYLCGGFCDELDQVPLLYTNAVSMLNANTAQNHGKVIMFDEKVQQDKAMLVFPMETESRLNKLVIMGQSDRIAPLISSVYMPSNGNTLSDTDLRYLNSWIYLSIARISASVHDQKLLEDAAFLTEKYSIQQIPCVSARIISILEQACQRINEEKAREEGRINDDMLKFMEENLSKSTFTLYDMALHFDYAEAYLYRMFRERFGCTFSVMLEKMRLEKACQALEAGKNIETVAAECGYNSSHAFRRAFKKNKGMLPSDYRSMSPENPR